MIYDIDNYGKAYAKTVELVFEVNEAIAEVWDEDKLSYRVSIDDCEDDKDDYKGYMPLVILKTRKEDGVKMARIDTYHHDDYIEVSLEYRRLNLSFKCDCVDYLPSLIASLLTVTAA